MDTAFISKDLRPYFKAVFADLMLRSTPSQTSGRSIDKVTFVEYINLPGIVSDRFYSLAVVDRSDGRISEELFLDLMLRTYSSSLEAKIKLSF